MAALTGREDVMQRFNPVEPFGALPQALDDFVSSWGSIVVPLLSCSCEPRLPG
jgi:hypothetical protein